MARQHARVLPLQQRGDVAVPAERLGCMAHDEDRDRLAGGLANGMGDRVDFSQRGAIERTAALAVGPQSRAARTQPRAKVRALGYEQQFDAVLLECREHLIQARRAGT